MLEMNDELVRPLLRRDVCCFYRLKTRRNCKTRGSRWPCPQRYLLIMTLSRLCLLLFILPEIELSSSPPSLSSYLHLTENKPRDKQAVRAGARFRRLRTGSVQHDDLELQRVGERRCSPGTATLSSSHSVLITDLHGIFRGGRMMEGSMGGKKGEIPERR